MTMISAYLMAEEVDRSEPDSFYHGNAGRRVSVAAVWIGDPGGGSEILPGASESMPEFYRLLKELSDELAVEAVEDQDTYEQLLGL